MSLINLQRIRLVATDCDGVLTDGGVYFTEEGTQLRRFSVLDGEGFRRLREAGILTALLSGAAGGAMAHRGKQLKIDHLITGRTDKGAALLELCGSLGISPEETAYLGDDLYDIPALELAGFSAAPPDALEEVHRVVDYVTKRPGGGGCFREVCQMILAAQEEKTGGA